MNHFRELRPAAGNFKMRESAKPSMSLVRPCFLPPMPCPQPSVAAVAEHSHRRNGFER